jgi:hypothetical protein
VLNLRENGSERYLAGDDDSGEDRNTLIRRRQQAGFTYVLPPPRLRSVSGRDRGDVVVSCPRGPEGLPARSCPWLRSSSLAREKSAPDRVVCGGTGCANDARRWVRIL